MYGVKIYLEPEDILKRLSEKDRARFNQCIFYDMNKMLDGSVEIDCILLNDSDVYTKSECRYKYCDDGNQIVVKE